MAFGFLGVLVAALFDFEDRWEEVFLAVAWFWVLRGTRNSRLKCEIGEFFVIGIPTIS